MIVELTALGRLGPWLTGFEFVRGMRANIHAAGEITAAPGQTASQQKSRANPGITYLKLHDDYRLPQVVQWAMKRKKRQPNSTDVQVGESIRAHRLIAGMSQSDLANRLGVSFQQVQKYEKGTNRVGAGRLPQIAAIFNIPIGALFEANADASHGKGDKRNVAPVRLISDKSTLRLLGLYTDIANPPIRRRLIQLVDEIAKVTRKSSRAGGGGRGV